ncbi:MAG TPA: antibiotic biosynthesis monooxygenase family protein [Candidatus Acidoferrum sp.]|nr:antibiotic biosynthesis monooxygenase family protein [Candidatus Acidoferrum sp.]
MPKRKAKPRKSARRKSRRKAASGGKLPKGAITLIVILRPREGQEILLEAELRALIGPTRKEEGCISYELHRAADGPGGFLLHEVWASREAHTEHMHTPHFLRWNAGKDALLTSRDGTFWKQIA